MKGRVRVGITPNEILSKEFASKFRGYDPEEVNDFLDIVRADFEKLISENDSMKKELADSSDKLDYFSQLQDSLNSSIMVAQDAAERLKQNARKEAELILFEAEREADRLVNEAAGQSSKIYAETDELRQTSKTYRQRLKQIVESHLAMINDEEFVELFEGGEQTEAFDFPPAASEVDYQVTSDAETEELSFAEESSEIASSAEALQAASQERTHDNESVPLSRQELEAMSAHAEAADSTSELETADDTPMESVLGQTIRIDLPK